MRNILIFPTHHKLSHDIAQLDAEFYFWTLRGNLGKWWFPGVPQPENCFYIGNSVEIDYDVAIVGAYDQALLVRKAMPNLPIIAVVGRGIEGNQELVLETGLIDTLVGGAKSNLRFSTHPRNRVIYRGFDPAVYRGYTGDIPYSISVGNGIADRAELQKEITDQVIAGLPHSYIGAGCELLPDGIGSLDHETMRGFYRSARVLINTSEPVLSGHCNAVCVAMLTGMPVAITPFADWPLLIENGVNGYVSNDVNELRQFVKQCLDSQTYAQTVGAAARRLIMEHFAPEAFVAQWEQLLREVCDNVSMERVA